MNTHMRRSSRRAAAAALAVSMIMAGGGVLAPAADAQAGAQAPASSTGDPAPVASSAGAPAGTQALADGYGLSAAQQKAVDQAAAQAAKTGQPVPISALTSETWQVSAEPGGGLELADNPAPVRTLQHGAWVPVDTTLHKNSDGTYTPAATAYATARLSGGGSGPLVTTTTSSGANYQLSWPTALPAPTVSGSSATYGNVIAGVDLRVDANATGGFSEVLIVHNAKAAADPRLAKLALAVHSSGTSRGTGTTLATAPDGLQLDLSDAMMWDSETTPTAPGSIAAKGTAGTSSAKAPSLAQVAASDPSDATHPGYAAHQAPLQVSSSTSSLTLAPDKAMLTAKDTVFPLYIDPSVSWHSSTPAASAYDEIKQGSPCNSQSYTNDTAEDDNSLGVGWTNTYCGGYQRTFYQWKLPPAIAKATIQVATVKATENWQASFSCSESRTVDLHLAVGIGAGTDYNNTNPGYITGSGAYSTSASVGAAYNPSGCQNPITSPASFTVTTPVQAAATSSASQITFVMDQGSNTNYADFDRFTDNPTLNISYDHAPTTPTAAQLSAAVGGSDTAACDTAAPYPYIGKAIATNNVTLTATNITSPDSDELQATFKYWITGSTTTATGKSADNLASGGNASYTLPAAFTQGLTDGQSVSWQVQTTNGTLTSGWSPTCTYTAEPTGPDEPAITANTTYPDNTTGAAAGTTATFTVTGNTDGTAATKFYYRLDAAPVTTGTIPATQIATATNDTATFTITPAWAGLHTLYVESVDAAGDVSGANSYTVIAAAHAPSTCASLTACFNNTAISPDTNPSQANADGNGNSLSATNLTAAGWKSTGGHMSIDGANLALPAYGTGQADNVLAANQTITCTSSQAMNCVTNPVGASALTFLTTATYGSMAEPGSISGDTTAPYIPAGTPVAGSYINDGSLQDAIGAPTGTINYADGTSDTYTLTVPDWSSGPSNLAAFTMPSFNNPAGKKTSTAKMYAFSIPLRPGATISSITLPDVSGTPGHGIPAVHIFSIGTRNTTTGTVKADGTTATLASPNTWTGAWASDNEGNYNYESSNFNNQSFRVLLQPTVTGSTIRVKLDNALGTSPLDIGHATVALTNGTAITPTAATSSTPVNLTFAGSTSTVIPEGAMLYSDPLPFNVTAGHWLAVSFQLTNSIPYLVEHSWVTDSYEYTAPIGSGDHTADTAATTYTATGSLNGTYTNLVTGLDVQTAGVPTQIVLGDNLIDAFEPNTAPLSPNNGAALRLSDDIAAASSTAPDPYGTINAGIESNQLVTDYPETRDGTTTGGAVGGPAALTRVDRDLLDEPGLNTVILDEGLEDALAGSDFATIEDAYNSLLGYLQDTGIEMKAGTDGASSTEVFPSIVDIGLTPCDTYNGDGAATGNDPCTTASTTTTPVDTIRTQINGWLAANPNGYGWWSPSPYYYVDPDKTIGVPDASDGATKLNPLAMVGTSRNNTLSDPVNLTNTGTGALANAILAATDTWTLTDGTGSTTAADSAPNYNANAYLTLTDPNPTSDVGAGTNFLTLAGTYTWATATVGANANTTVLSLDGTSGYGSTGNTVVNTTGSYSISAWVDPAAPTSGAQVIAGECGNNHCALYFGITSGGYWQIGGQGSDTASDDTYYGATYSTATAAANTWTHVVATFNAATDTYALYLNGSLAATAAGRPTGWGATGPLTVGGLYILGSGTPVTKNFLDGEISNLKTYNYALSAPQITALHDQITPLDQ
ncbi:LamG-like jellyroll fold domain-containing protein [Actinospica robiniae]|uniref:LamG-like jellyroll fold domain-containing protein n=1 Tax=Actinospica robiniae DSM 44927 TaxID=479430 RepID=W9DWG6_9ACTN|nr:LamG-like jellyroll fold domain-containing protein [Actinospica robiniae]ETA71174.1 hypothetical protein ActroDRAFT_0206 [Actinospica robiniae DSM 44927]